MRYQLENAKQILTRPSVTFQPVKCSKESLLENNLHCDCIVQLRL